MHKIPSSLRGWFVIHFMVDMLFGLPLFFAPVFTLSLFGFTSIEPVTARLVAAALLGIGGISFVAKNKKVESYQTLLTLKIIWSSAAMVGLLWSIIDGSPRATWLLLLIFALFSAVWIYYYRKLR